MNDDEKWKRDCRREDAEFFDELLEDKPLIEGLETAEFFVGLPEDYDECNVVLLIGFKDEAPLDEFRRELRHLGSVEFGGQERRQIAIAEIDE
jgi:hypothetical protein